MRMNPHCLAAPIPDEPGALSGGQAVNQRIRKAWETEKPRKRLKLAETAT